MILDLNKLGVGKIIEMYSNAEITRYQLMNALNVYEIKKYNSMINAAEKKRESIIKLNRNTQIIWITGASGTGKSNTLAKWICKKQGYTVSVGNAGQHFAEGYQGTDAFIIDDFRGSKMPFAELLNFTDNIMNVKAAARYADVDFSDCKLIIITSILPPSRCYTSETITQDEPIRQFFRRLGFFTKDENGVVKADKTYLKIGSLEVGEYTDYMEFSDKPAASVPEGVVAVFNCEDDQLNTNYKFISMRGPYEETKVELKEDELKNTLGF